MQIVSKRYMQARGDAYHLPLAKQRKKERGGRDTGEEEERVGGDEENGGDRGERIERGGEREMGR